MSAFFGSLWAETLKGRRSRAYLLSVFLFAMFPLVSGLFMVVLKDPQAAQAMGLISLKAQIVAGSADWPTYFDMLKQATALGGYILFAFITAWVFGREFADRTAKDLMAVPTGRGIIVGAKFLMTGLWVFGLTLIVILMGFLVGAWVRIPGWSINLAGSSFGALFTISAINYALMPFVALFASAGGGYLPALGWAFTSFILAQLVSVLGWGDWLPWSVPVLISGMFGPQGAEQVGQHSYILVLLAFIAGLSATVAWWLRADQTR